MLKICSLTLCTLAAPALAQENIYLEDRLNNAGICAQLPELDTVKVAELVGYDLNIPDFLPIDLNARWDKDKHRVSRAENVDGKAILEATLGCEPSSQSAIILALPISPEDVRLNENIGCEGTINEDGSVEGVTCDVSGEIGAFFANFINFEERMAGVMYSWK